MIPLCPFRDQGIFERQTPDISIIHFILFYHVLWLLFEFFDL